MSIHFAIKLNSKVSSSIKIVIKQPIIPTGSMD